MKDALNTFLILSVCFILAILLIIAGGWIVMGSNFALFKYFAPRVEAVRRETFEQSKAYNQGMTQEIQNMQFEYVQASDSQKEALASIILHRVADYDVSKLPPDTQVFINQLKTQRTQ